MNITVFIGRLVKDIELYKTTNGKSVTTVSIAIDKGFGENKKTVFPQIVFWGSQADYLSKYARKGTLISVECEYDEKFNNNKKTCEFVCKTVKILSNGIDNKDKSNKPTQTNSFLNNNETFEIPNITSDGIQF